MNDSGSTPSVGRTGPALPAAFPAAVQCLRALYNLPATALFDDASCVTDLVAAFALRP
ncbi:MAG: hypothetical protein M9930_19920 [Anaerolineae bacterium]|nr:hypothetical protein [Anaerolineae bacterium]